MAKHERRSSSNSYPRRVALNVPVPLLGLIATVAVAVLLAPALRAEKLDKRAQEWVKDIGLLILPEEEKTYRELKDPDDRIEFERIFWARRDPNPATPENELQNAWQRACRRADELFTQPGERGSRTGCGRVFLLLGDASEVVGRGMEVYTAPQQKKAAEGDAVDTTYRMLKEGSRRPETWIYRSRVGDELEFAGGELRVAFDEACRFAEAGRLLDELRRAAQAKVRRPEITFKRGPDGRLVRLEAMTGAVSPALALLREERVDFPFATEVKLLLRSQAGDAYAAALVRGQAGPDEIKAGRVEGRVAAEARDATGRIASSSERLFSAPVDPDGSFLASFGLTLKPGQYTLRAAAVVPGGRGSVASVPLEVPNFNAGELTMGQLLIFPAAAEEGTDDATNPYAPFVVGPLRLRPRYGNTFVKQDEIQAVCVVYDAGVDASTGRASLKARFSFLKDGRRVARGGEEILDTPTAVASVGPVSLTGFAPGRYTVSFELTDGVTGKSYSQELPFEIREAP